MDVEGQNDVQAAPEVESNVIVEKYKVGSWEQAKEEIMNIENEAFDGKGYGNGFMNMIFESDIYLNYLLKDLRINKIVGYTSVSVGEDEAYIMNTAIASKYRGKGNVGKLMDELESELKSRGVKYLTRHSAVENGYADNVQNHYGDRIVETSERDSPWGVQRYFKIKL